MARENDQHKDSERDLLGNGTLTVFARLSSVIGIPVLISGMTWFGAELWDDVKQLKRDNAAHLTSLAVLDANMNVLRAAVEQHNQRIERMRESLVLRNNREPQ